MFKSKPVPEKPNESHPIEGKKSEINTSDPAPKNKGREALPGNCFAWNCKTSATRFNFCEEHYDHFKFGLIKKTGEPVSDYEKKIEHYTAYKSKQRKKQAA